LIIDEVKDKNKLFPFLWLAVYDTADHATALLWLLQVLLIEYCDPQCQVIIGNMSPSGCTVASDVVGIGIIIAICNRSLSDENH